MSKFSRELKFKIVKKYLGGTSPKELLEEYAVSGKHVRYWAHVYSIHGSKSFLVNSNAMSTEAKMEALTLMWKNGWSTRQISAMLDLSFPTTLRTWLRKYNKYGIEGLNRRSGARSILKKRSKTTPKSDDNMTLEELKEELAYLRAENAVLKKLEELEQQKSHQIKKKR